MPRLALLHARQEADDHLQRPEVVELHRALEVVETFVGVLDRAADRAPALLTRMSTRPCSARISSTTLSQSSMSERSAL